jgi:D-3-phosphoglycerate dehydrogenase
VEPVQKKGATATAAPEARSRILITDPMAPESLAILAADPQVQVDHLPGITPQELLGRIADYEALMVRSGTQVSREVIEAGSRLKVIGRAGTGVDNIDVEAATARGIVVMNAPTGNTIAATEHTLSMMLALARRVPEADRSLKAGEWLRGHFLGVELLGKTLAIVGFGRIGREVAKRAAAFGMRIVVHDPYVAPDQLEIPGAEMKALDAVLAEADFITLHLPLTPATRHIIDDAAFARMKRGVRLVNVSRGGIVDEGALARALESGRVAGAALDVFEQEPPAGSPLLLRNDVIVTPHLGASTREAQELVSVAVAEQVLDYLRGRPARNAVNLPSLTPEMGERARPFILLAERLGAMQAQLAQGPPRAVHVRFAGEVAELGTEVLALGLYKGLLTPSLGDRVNLVNCRAILKERHVAVNHTRSDDAGEFSNLIQVTVESENSTHTVGGIFRRDSTFRLTEVDGYAIDASLHGGLIVLKNLDVPGVVGRIGTILGNRRVNIAFMTWGRRGERGQDALTVINIDSLLGPAGVAELAADPTVLWVREVVLPPSTQPAE